MRNVLQDKKILITGGGGFLGFEIVRQLVENGSLVTSLSRNRYPKLECLGVSQIQGDIKDGKVVMAAAKEADMVFHVAAKAGIWGQYRQYYQTNVIGTQNIIDACFQNQIRQLIYTSSPSVIFDGTDMEGVDESVPYPDRFDAYYPETKALAEQNVIKATQDGLKAIILRPHIIWGSGDNHLIRRLIARPNKIVQIGEGNNLVDTVLVENAAHAHLLAATKLHNNPNLSGRIYFISQDEPIKFWDLISFHLEAAGLPPIRRSMQAGFARVTGKLMEMSYKLFRIKSEPPMTNWLAKELATAHWFNINAAKTDLDYRPQISIKEGLKQLEEYFKDKKTSLRRPL